MRPARLSTILLALAAPAAAADAPPLAVTAGFAAEAPVTTVDALRLNLSRPLASEEGRLAILVGTTDWTDLFVLRGDSVSFVPGPASLPAGTSEVSVYLVRPGGDWTEVGRLPLTVVAPVAVPRALKPALDVAWKSQFRETHRPESAAPPRPISHFPPSIAPARR